MHVEHFAPHFPNFTFQPSDYERHLLDSIRAYAKDCPTRNICSPMQIDIRKPYTEWGQNRDLKGPYLKGNSHLDFAQYKGLFDVMLNINMIHITEFDCTEGLFFNAGQLLKPSGLLITYGPYAENGVLQPESNVRFDAGLRCENPGWGVRDIALLKEVAAKNGIRFVEKYEMPANNKTLVWQKES